MEISISIIWGRRGRQTSGGRREEEAFSGVFVFVVRAWAVAGDSVRKQSSVARPPSSV